MNDADYLLQFWETGPTVRPPRLGPYGGNREPGYFNWALAGAGVPFLRKSQNFRRGAQICQGRGSVTETSTASLRQKSGATSSSVLPGRNSYSESAGEELGPRLSEGRDAKHEEDRPLGFACPTDGGGRDP